MSDIVLSAGVRQNLLALQTTAKLMSITQNRLATGKKVNSALDNPVNFFTASGLQARAADLSALLDAMSNGVKTLEAADNGLTAITTTLQSMKSTLLQARQDKSFKVGTYTLNAAATATTTASLTLSGGAVTGSVSVDLANSQGVRTGAAYTDLDFEAAGPVYGQQLNFNITANGGTARAISVTATTNTNLAVTVDGGPATNFTVANANAVTGSELAGAINAAFDAAATPVAITAGFGGGALSFTADTAVTNSSADVTVTGVAAVGTTVVTTNFGFGATGGGGTLTKINPVAQTVDQIVAAINANASLVGKVRASNDNGKLQIENDSTTDLTLTGVTANTTIDGGVGTTTIGGNLVRANLATQFNELRDQLNKLAADASLNGTNLLNGDVLKLIFNEAATSSLTIQAKDSLGNPFAFNATNLGIGSIVPANLDTDASIDSLLTSLSQALNLTRSQASNFGSSLSIVQNRQDFTKAMINTLETGADNLTLADTNEEGANLLALQTRQQLSTTALSLAAQADQAVLRLFG